VNRWNSDIARITCEFSIVATRGQRPEAVCSRHLRMNNFVRLLLFAGLLLPASMAFSSARHKPRIIAAIVRLRSPRTHEHRDKATPTIPKRLFFGGQQAKFRMISRLAVSAALYSVLWLAIWSGLVLPAAHAHHSLTITTAPHVETIAEKKETTLPWPIESQ
jgi:hypothetical protein